MATTLANPHQSAVRTTYAWILLLYRTRDYAPKDSLNAYHGILNRILGSLNTSDVVGLPKSILDLALLWYHKPDMNKLNGKTPQRVPGWPSWTWAAWNNAIAVNFIPLGETEARMNWVDRYTGDIQFWYTDSQGTNLKQAHTGAHISHHTPPRWFTAGSGYRFLQFKTWVTREAVVTFGPTGVGQIKTMAGALVGMVYADDLQDYGPQGSMLATLSKAPYEDNNFDYGIYYPHQSGLVHEGQDLGSLIERSPIPAKNQDIQWVMLLGSDRQFTWRRGLGFVHTNKYFSFNWAEKWVALM